MPDERTCEPLSVADLEEVRRFAEVELRRFTEKVGQPAGKYQGYRDRLLAMCLVQGAAQHFVDTRPGLAVDHQLVVDQADIDESGYLVTDDGRVMSGVKDLDVVLFFRADAAVPIPSRNHCMKSVVCDFKRLGRRRVDFMKKGIGPDITDSLAAADLRSLLRRYLMQTDHGRAYLSKKSVVALHPAPVFGHPLWVTRRLL